MAPSSTPASDRRACWPAALPVAVPPGTDLPFTAAQAAGLGATRHGLRALVEAGILVRILRGVYVSAGAEDTPRLRARALSLVMPPGCFVVDRAAAWLHGAPRVLGPGEEGSPVPGSWCRPLVSDRIGRRPGAGHERLVGPGDLTQVHGVPVTTPLRTAGDLGLRQPRDVAMAGMDALARLGLVSRSEVVDTVERFRGRRGVAQLRELAPLVDPGSSGYGPSALRLRWLDAGLPEPATEISVSCTSGVGTVHLDVGLEHVGAAVYDDHTLAARPEQLARRLDWIREQAGWQIELLDRRSVFGPGADAVGRLARAFGRTAGSRDPAVAR